MSQYNPVKPTIQGQAMIAESLKTETGLVFTKVEWGDGIVSRGEQYPTFTALKNKVIESPISKMERQDATLYITSVVNNSTLSTGFYCREIGVWAKIGANGTEQLFAYTYAENASYTPSSNQYNEKRIRIGLGVDANVNVTIKFNSEVYLTRQELEDHNTDPTAHPDIRQKLNTNASNITALQNSINGLSTSKQDKLTFDLTPTAGSSNPVTSSGIKTALDGKPSNTGAGASGTWGINISGNAGSASKLASKVKLNATNFDGSQNIFVPQTPYIIGIDLRDIKYDRDTWYPCYRGTGNGQPLNDTEFNENWVSLICSTSIKSGSLDAKGAGFNNGIVVGQEHRVAILTRGFGLGSTTLGNIILDNSNSYCSDKSYIPIGYMEVSNRIPCFYLLGGYDYRISCSDKAVGWTVVTEETKLSYEKSFSPVKAYPGIQKTRLEVSCNIDGNAATATKATQDGNGNIIANTYLPLTGGTVTGTLNVPTQATTDNSTKVANTAFVQSAVSKLVNSAPATLDTLNELANALGNDPNFATTVTKMISQKADKTVVDNIVNVMYPVGIIVEFAKDVDPNATWVGTTWERMSSGRVLVSSGTSSSGTTYTLGKTGGEESHKLTTDEMPTHNHASTTSSEGGHTHTGTTDTNGNHTHTLHKGSGGSGGAYFSQGQVYGGNSGTVTPPEVAGNHSHTLTTSSDGTHTHAITVSNTGGGEAHNNMQPYEVVNRWKRTA